MSAANERAHQRLIAAKPDLTQIAPLGTLVDLPPGNVLLHAGPPFADPADLPPPMRHAAIAAALHEGFAATEAEARAALEAGTISLIPAQDHGVVTPLAFVAGASMPALEVRDPVSGVRRVSPLNDGPLPHALRFGTGRAEGLALVKTLSGGVGASFAAALAAPVPLLPLFAGALADGDDLHGRVDAAQAALRPAFNDLAPEAEAYLTAANQFVLNVIMAGAAVMLGAAAGEPGATLVVAAGGNGRDFGWKVAGDPDTWITRPSSIPAGPRLPAHADRAALPAIGDSAVIDALGFGAACLRYAPDLAGTVRAHVDAAYFDARAHEAYLGPHPALPADIRVGLDLDRPRTTLGIMLGVVDAAGEAGLIGRGIAAWPAL